jgi:hypothetical protein
MMFAEIEDLPLSAVNVGHNALDLHNVANPIGWRQGEIIGLLVVCETTNSEESNEALTRRIEASILRDVLLIVSDGRPSFFPRIPDRSGVDGHCCASLSLLFHHGSCAQGLATASRMHTSVSS